MVSDRTADRPAHFESTEAIAASDRVDYQQLLKVAHQWIDLAVCPKTQCLDHQGEIP